MADDWDSVESHTRFAYRARDLCILNGGQSQEIVHAMRDYDGRGPNAVEYVSLSFLVSSWFVLDGGIGEHEQRYRLFFPDSLSNNCSALGGVLTTIKYRPAYDGEHVLEREVPLVRFCHFKTGYRTARDLDTGGFEGIPVHYDTRVERMSRPDLEAAMALIERIAEAYRSRSSSTAP